VLFTNVAVPAEYVPPVTKVSCVDNPVMLDPLPYKVVPLIVVADIVFDFKSPLTVNPLTESIYALKVVFVLSVKVIVFVKLS